MVSSAQKDRQGDRERGRQGEKAKPVRSKEKAKRIDVVIGFEGRGGIFCPNQGVGIRMGEQGSRGMVWEEKGCLATFGLGDSFALLFFYEKSSKRKKNNDITKDD